MTPSFDVQPDDDVLGDDCLSWVCFYLINRHHYSEILNESLLSVINRLDRNPID